MQINELMEMLRRVVAESSQAEVARRIGCSSPALSQILSGTYNAKGSGGAARILEKFEAAYGGTTIDCPIMGEVALANCLDARRRLELPFVPSSRQTADLRQTCPDCRNGGRR